MKTTNGLNVPTGWAQTRQVKKPCPVCLNGTEVVTNAANLRVLDDHTRQARGEYGRSHCPGSGRLVR